MKAPFDIAADLDTPVSAYLKLAPFSPHFLLESADGGEQVGRNSFIGFGPALELRIDDTGARIGAERLPQPASQTELLDLFRNALSRAPWPGRTTPEVPFSGGLVGVSSFDMVRQFESLGSARSARCPTPLAAYVAPRSLLVFDHLTRRVALLHDGPEAERQELRREVIRALRGPTPNGTQKGRTTIDSASFDRAGFVEAVAAAQEQIAEGEVYQLVLSICFSGRTEIDPFTVYRALRLLNPSPYMYFNDFGDFAVVGSSPEALVKLVGREASLRPIAGTRPRGGNAAVDGDLEQELLEDPKEAAEHVMLVDLARNDLGRVALTGTVNVDPYRKIERYSHVMHLVSGVRGVLAPGQDCFDLFAASFPAGTVVGAPKVRAVELIDRFEPVGRGIYAGCVGYFGHGGSMDQAIAIRTLVFASGTCSYQAGAGIVADSVPEHEYEEVLAKSAALTQALELAENGL